MPANLGGWTGLILILVVILLFAAPKLPGLARSLGQSMTIFKKEVRAKDDDDTSPGSAAAPTSEDAASSTTATDAESPRSTVG